MIDASSIDQLMRITPASRLRAVAPENADLPQGVAKSLWIVEGGDLTVIAEDDTQAITVPVVAGQVFPVRVKRVAASTTASVVALY